MNDQKKRNRVISCIGAAVVLFGVAAAMFFHAVPADAGEKGKIWFEDPSWGEITLIDIPYAPRYVFVPRFWYSADGTEAAESRTVVEGDYTFLSSETGKRMTDEEIIKNNGDPALLEWKIDDSSVAQFDFENGILLPQKAGETVFTLLYKGAECKVPITVRMIDPEDPSDAEAFREEVWKVELAGLEEGAAIEDTLHHAGLYNEIYLSPMAFFRHSMALCIDTTADPNFKCFVKDERIASLKPFGVYLLLETLEPGTTEIGFSWYGIEVSYPITVCRNTVEEIFCDDREWFDDGTFKERPIYGDLNVVLPNADDPCGGAGECGRTALHRARRLTLYADKAGGQETKMVCGRGAAAAQRFPRVPLP